MAKKVDLEAAHERYLAQCASMRGVVAKHDYPEALRIAADSLDVAWDAVNYQRKYMQVERPALPTVDATLRIAPAMFDWRKLDALETWLGAAKRTDKQVYAPLRAEMDAARREMALAARLWDGADAAAPARVTLEEKPAAMRIFALWTAMGATALRQESGIDVHCHVTRPKGDVVGKCLACGETHQSDLAYLLDGNACVFCRKNAGFVLTRRVF